jgi:hypothetical protein
MKRINSENNKRQINPTKKDINEKVSSKFRNSNTSNQAVNSNKSNFNIINNNYNRASKEKINKENIDVIKIAKSSNSSNFEAVKKLKEDLRMIKNENIKPLRGTSQLARSKWEKNSESPNLIKLEMKDIGPIHKPKIMSNNKVSNNVAKVFGNSRVNKEALSLNLDMKRGQSPTNKVSKPSEKYSKIKSSDPFAVGKKHKTNFGYVYSAGGIPCRIQHGSVRMRLKWDIEPESILF